MAKKQSAVEARWVGWRGVCSVCAKSYLLEEGDSPTHFPAAEREEHYQGYCPCGGLVRFYVDPSLRPEVEGEIVYYRPEEVNDGGC